MDENEFKNLMRRAQRDAGDYATGYQRGLRRHYHGERFGTTAEHTKWTSLGQDGDHREELGRGYRDGLTGQPPQQKEDQA